MRIFVTGASGFLGSSLINNYSGQHQIIGSYFTHKIGNAFHLDVSNKYQVKETLEKAKADVVIHAAATRNDKAEVDHEIGFKVIVEGTANLVEVCKALNVFIVYISSDLIFDGKKGLYSEADPSSPVSYFGEMKVMAEKILRESMPESCIARTSLLYGWSDRSLNFATMVIKNLREKLVFKALSDQFVSPSYVANVADMIIEICERRLSGVYNVAGSSRLTRYQFAQQVAGVFLLDKNLIKPITMDEMEWTTKRGSDCSLDVSLVARKLRTKPLSTIEGLQAMKRDEGA